MALYMAKNVQLVFFQKLFGVESPYYKLAQDLNDVGGVFSLTLFSVEFTYKGITEKVALKVSPTNILKSAATPEDYALVGKEVGDWLTVLGKQVGLDKKEEVPPVKEKTYSIKLMDVPADGAVKIPIIKFLRMQLGISLKEAKDIVDAASNGKPFVYQTGLSYKEASAVLTKAMVETKGKFVLFCEQDGLVVEALAITQSKQGSFSEPVATKPVNSVVKLVDALALGQKVSGTSAGSVYYCIAYNSNLKIAARFSGHEVSLRAEWKKKIPSEVSLLASNGMKVTEKYASLHLALNGVPPARVVGAFLMGLGMEFSDQVTSAKQLVGVN
jgi:ribosomal protein L7/L12